MHIKTILNRVQNLKSLLYTARCTGCKIDVPPEI